MLIGGGTVNSDNGVGNAARMNNCGKSLLQSQTLMTKNGMYEKAFYGNDSWENNYCFNTTSWD